MNAQDTKRVDHTPTDLSYNGTFEDWVDALELRIEGDALVETYKAQRKAGRHFFMRDKEIWKFLEKYYVDNNMMSKDEAKKMFRRAG